MRPIGMLGLCVAMLAGCVSDPAREADRAYQGGLAVVTHLSVRTPPGGLAANAVANVRGTLPDACTEIDRIDQSLLGNHIELQITTRRPFGSICAQQVVPFERTFPISAIGLLPGGLYTAEANGVQTTFTVPLDPL